MPAPRVVQKWPGKHMEVHNKVPTTVLYWPSSKNVKEWGFQCLHSNGKKEWFKRLLDPEKLESFRETVRKQRAQNPADSSIEDAPELSEVRKWYRDYLTCLYGHLSTSIQATTGKWAAKHVEFVLSLPCTFEKPSISQALLVLAKQAGFGQGGPQHTVSIGLTEPEAAAVFTMKDTAIDFKAEDIVLVCDAGGGTTDLACLEVVGVDDGQPELRELTVVDGQNIGATNVDVAFEKMVEERLEKVEPKLDDRTAWTMMHEPDFAGWKCNFGQEDNKIFNSFPITVPMIESNFSHHGARIRGGKMHFSQEDFKSIFDPEVEKMIVLILKQMEDLAEKYQKKQIDYIVLSGGLGSSAYVREKLEEAFVGGDEHPDLQILVSEEPQLCVAKGLVIDRIQKLKSGKAVLKGRVCRASYGLETMVLYDEKKHVGQPVTKSIDGKNYATNQIEWIIKKGEPIDPEKPIDLQRIRIFTSDATRIWHTHVVMSLNKPDRLPINTLNADASSVCRIKYDLSNVPLDQFEMKKGPSEKLKFNSQPYYNVHHEARITVGPADLKFEIWYKGAQYGKDNIAVEWDKAPAPHTPTPGSSRFQNFSLPVR